MKWRHLRLFAFFVSIFAGRISTEPLLQRSDIPIEEDDLEDIRQLDLEIKKDLDRFEEIKKVT
jgi:hypothetical protein